MPSESNGEKFSIRWPRFLDSQRFTFHQSGGKAKTISTTCA